MLAAIMGSAAICTGLFFVVNGHTEAQGTRKQGIDQYATQFQYNIRGDQFTSNVPLNEIRPAVFRRFKRHFPNVEREQWHKIRSGFLVVFKDTDSSLNYALFDTFGNLVRKIACYSATNAPRELTEAIRYDYSSYNIEAATKLTEENKVLYGVLISKGNEIKSLEFKNGELSLLAEYRILPLY
jgi:hypothetical protein